MTGASVGKVRELSTAHYQRITGLLADLAEVSGGGTGQYFDDLLRQAPLTKAFRQQRYGTFGGAAGPSARALISWAQALGRNPREPSWTTLGSILRTVLESGAIGVDEAALVAGMIESYELCVDGTERAKFRLLYGVPSRTAAADGEAPDVGPDINWAGPTDALELQGWLGPEPVSFALEFLQAAVRRAHSVCKIALPSSQRTGSGVLVGANLVLTNHHVLFGENGSEVEADALAKECTVSFSGLSAASGGSPEAAGPLDLANVPIAARSRVLDYALLRLSPDLGATQGLNIAPLTGHRPAEKDGVNLLHHPRGEAMQVSMCGAGVTRVLDGPGFVQYITRSAPGSSGGPCFDDDWNLAALHHAERSRPFGRVGEGILIERIHAEIKQHLA